MSTDCSRIIKQFEVIAHATRRVSTSLRRIVGYLNEILIGIADELLVAMALHVAADDGAVEDVEGSEQCGRAVTFVVVGHRASTSRLHRQPWLGAIERLNLTLFVDREDDLANSSASLAISRDLRSSIRATSYPPKTNRACPPLCSQSASAQPDTSLWR